VRYNIQIDDRLMRRAMKNSGITTKKEVVKAALELLVTTYSRDPKLQQTK